MIVAFCILALLITIVITGRIRLSLQFNKEVKELFSQSKIISKNTFAYQQLTGMPEPAQRYFKHVLKDGQPYISYARITHDGQFKTWPDKGWINIQGEQYATTEKPGFIWKGTTAMFVARDMYIADKGRLVVSLFSLYKVADAQGSQYNQGELLRWLGESVLYPTNLLPSNRLQWIAIDVQTAKLVFNYNGLSLFFIIRFNEIGEIIQMETERYMDAKKLEPWVIKLSNYKEVNGVVIPMSFDVLWRLKEGDFSYARFNIKKVEYHIAAKF